MASQVRSEVERCGNMGNIEDYVKRKRSVVETEGEKEEERQEDIFKRSNKVARSPGGKGDREYIKELFSELGGELREGMRAMREEVRAIAEGQREVMRNEMELLRRELREKEVRWMKEREDMEKRIEEIKREIERIKESRGGPVAEREDEEGRGGYEKGKSEWADRMKRLERRYEMREREERKKNVVIKGIKEGKEGIRKGVEEVMGMIEVEVAVEEVRKIDAGRTDKGSMVIVRVGSGEEKRRIMQNKKRLRGKDIWMEDDLTWEERRIRWKLKQVVWQVEAEGGRARIGQGRVWIEGTWWVWDEEKEELRDSKRRCWEESKKNREKRGGDVGGRCNEGE